MKKPGIWLLAAAAAAILALVAVSAVVSASMPHYPDVLGNLADPQKITGTYLQAAAAEKDDILPVFGSSELKTTDICTHPANFFAGKRCGFQVDLIGRGSCQSLVHAMAIAASGDSLRGRKVMLITAPQSYVEEGIASDLFMGNFSELQMLQLLRDDTLPAESRQYLAMRVKQLIDAYNAERGTSLQTATAAGLLASAAANQSRPAELLLQPYAMLSQWLLRAKDRADSAKVIRSVIDAELPAMKSAEIDWDAETALALEQAAEMVTNNDYYMQDSYYNTYIGKKLQQQAGKDAGLSYAVSPEYDDLRCLLDICAAKELDVLFIHVPVNGKWSDYTGFAAENRAAYYDNVRRIAERYDNVQLLDLTGFEYEPYFLCDTMHLGWKGWLEVDRAMAAFWNEN